MSLLLLHPETPRDHVSFPYIMGFDITLNLRRIQTTRSKASHCYRCNYCHCCAVDFVLFHGITLILFYHASMLLSIGTTVPSKLPKIHLLHVTSSLTSRNPV
jgi:hypothetical protein